MKTKIAFALLLASFTATMSFGQTDTTASSTKVHYTATDLTAKGKLDLTRIYLQQVENLNNILPYAAFPIRGQASNIKSIDIPASKYTENKRERVSDKVEKYNSTMNESLYEIIPYTDKSDLIKGILFVQEMIDRVDKGL